MSGPINLNVFNVVLISGKEVPAAKCHLDRLGHLTLSGQSPGNSMIFAVQTISTNIQQPVSTKDGHFSSSLVFFSLGLCKFDITCQNLNGV